MSQTDQRAAEVSTTFSQPIRAITTMLLVCALVGSGAWLIHAQIIDIVRTNPILNGIIALVFLFGVLSCFWQVWILAQSVYWIENFVRGTPGSEDEAPPRLLAPLAALLRSRSARMSISASSSRSIQDSVVQRIDEARDITRYLINLLVFLGLLGTFWGLATTVPAVVETIRSLAPQEGESGLDVFGKLMGGLESQLGGMGTAFSSSLLGLAGSLVLGLLELFAGHGQNRFIRELEEWLSSITRLGYAGDGDSADQNALGMLVDHMAQQMEELQALQTQTENSRFQSEMKINELVAAMTQLTDRIDAERGQSALLRRVAEGQERLLAALETGEAGGGSDPESRMRLRSIDVQLLRILEEMAAGRQETLTDLKSDIGQLTMAIRQLGRGAGRA
ncbi:biopolymer transporter ExbB [Rhodobacter sp. SY28-1]|uniref:biopolymer transporter ExbB n=1 Tax=Rhodobacter sp. SY28-1 TaxID=2562317 RepID=UPI0010BF814C|nr:biopolymer transporter ExbB [Rhodobacter sp. SY28-1]